MMRHAIFVTILVAVGFGCIRLGERGARALERLLIDRVEHGLAVLEIDWAEVRADGLRLELHGHAPDIFARDLALESARATAPIAVVTDFTTASLAPSPVRRPIRVEMLRDDHGLTLTGRFHGERMRDRLIAALAASSPGLEVHDLTGINAARPGAGWGAELNIAALAAARVPNAYVRIEPGSVRVGGLVRDADHGQEVSMELLALAGDTVRLTLQLRAPLVVVAPFVFAVVKVSPGGLRLEACASRDAEEQAMLEAALNRLGIAPGEVRCPAALGGPTGDWAGAAAAGLGALDLLPAGRFRLSYRSAELEAMAPAGDEELASARAALAAALPEGYVLRDGLGAGDAARTPAPRAVRYWMRFSRVPGAVVLSGAVPDETARRVIETHAAARFGQAAPRSALMLAGAGVPAGWEAAALVALDALSGVSVGEAELSPGRIAVSGTVAGPAEAGRLHRLLAGEAPEGYAVASALTIDLPARVAAAPLSAPRCAVVLSAAVKGLPIAFAPGSAVFETVSGSALDRLGEIFRRCGRGRIEIGGHTDSQGSQGLNQRLSRARAEAVLDALMARGVALDRLAARGYGEEQPVASNQTEAGRARNRRIEFTVSDQGCWTEGGRMTPC
jgi:OOP family OmpA-OmpF porin